MSRVKEKLPDTHTLENRLDEVLKSDLTDFLNTTHARRQEVVGSIKFVVVSVVFLLAVFTFLFLIGAQLNTFLGKFVIGLSLLWAVVLLVSGRSFYTNSILLAREMNMALVPILTNTLDRMLMYTHTEERSESVEDVLKQSKLITTDNIVVHADDVYEVYGDREMTMHELSVWQTEPTASNRKKPREQEVFRGLLVVAQLERTHSAETYISTEGDRFGFAHRSFWNDLLEYGHVTETVLEWNDFEKDLHVASTDHAAAREILTPDFMMDLHEWWGDHALNMRISFIGDQMFLLLPEESIRISSTTVSTEEAAIKRYAWSIVRPIWRALVLVEDIPR